MPKSIRADLAQWIEESILFYGYEIRNLKPPYSVEDLSSMLVTVTRLKLLYSLMRRFDIQINARVYDDFVGFTKIRT